MKITVTNILLRLKDSCYITFTSEQGTANACWSGKEPEVGQEYIVELDIPHVLIRDIDVTQSEVREYSIKSETDYTILTGQLESSFDDGCYDLRFGTSVIMLEMLGEPYPFETYLQVKVKSKNMYLYNAGV
ncbi:hypothetical protein [Paenibacillus dakarensis]|uniref:hypothetical protein n=1 Tax=Paenibacillus dakarensis TaxID=1527293 RepID=UPI0006D549D7|nr:hypothetical protein [Paenibacillus dakarensis]